MSKPKVKVMGFGAYEIHIHSKPYMVGIHTRDEALRLRAELAIKNTHVTVVCEQETIIDSEGWG